MVERFIAGRPGEVYISLTEGMTAMARNRGELMQKRFFVATAAAVMAVGVAACAPSPASPSQGALPAGTARVTINDKALPAMTGVKCAPIGSLMTITSANAAAGVTAVVSNATGLTAKSVSITDLGGFTGSYVEGLDGKTEVSMTGQTYMIRGTADGFDTHNPSMKTSGSFSLQVGC